MNHPDEDLTYDDCSSPETFFGCRCDEEQFLEGDYEDPTQQGGAI